MRKSPLESDCDENVPHLRKYGRLNVVIRTAKPSLKAPETQGGSDWGVGFENSVGLIKADSVGRGSKSSAMPVGSARSRNEGITE